ncbi:MAG: hypothetical protein M1288_03760 [Actinobacteria bacterium]|nr:hypothetical protein [Actinomycetota bacterium]
MSRLIPNSLASIAFGFLASAIFSGMGLSKADKVGTSKGIAITGLVQGILIIFFMIIPGINLL